MLQSPDHSSSQTSQKSALSDEYDSLDSEKKSQVDELHKRRVLFYIYMMFNNDLNKRHLSEMSDSRVLLIQHLVEKVEKQ